MKTLRIFSLEFFLEKPMNLPPVFMRVQANGAGWFLRLLPYFDCAPGGDNCTQNRGQGSEIRKTGGLRGVLSHV
jgi:hypothetical protein